MTRNVLPDLPLGITVGDRTPELEMVNKRNATRWIPILETLKVIDTSKCVEMDVKGFAPTKIASIKNSLRLFARRAGFKHLLRYALKDDVLYIWTNR